MSVTRQMFRPHSDVQPGSRRPAALRSTSGILEKLESKKEDVCEGLQQPPGALPPTWRGPGDKADA